MLDAFIARGRYTARPSAHPSSQDNGHTELEALCGDAGLLNRARELNALRDALPAAPPPVSAQRG